jgi:hypothetical protein
MSNGGDNWSGASVNGVRDQAMIECVKILSASTSARDQNHIDAHLPRGKIDHVDGV